MWRISIFVFASLCCLPVVSYAASSREIVLADRAGHPEALRIDRRGKNLTIEICADVCELFDARRMQSEDEVWDVVFLHQAFFREGAAAKLFRAKNAAHVSSVMAANVRKCSKYPQDVTRATCIVKYLAGQNRIDYATVRYEGGNRCEMAGDLLVAVHPAGKGKCAKAKDAR